METTLTAGSIRKAATQRTRDHAAHRRAYIDTYARRRVGLPDTPKKTAVVGSQMIAPAQTLQPTVSTSQAQKVVQSFPTLEFVQQKTQHVTPQAVAKPAQVAAPQVVVPNPPVVSEFVSTPRSAVQQAASQPKVAPESATIAYRPAINTTPEPQLRASHKNYLESLAKRHIQATKQAAVSEDTVFESALQEETDALFEDSQNNQKLAANLRALYESPLSNQITKDSKSASAAHIRTIIASAFACGILAVGIFSFVTSYDSAPVVAQPVGAPVIEVEAPVQQPTSGNPIAPNHSVAPEVNPEHPVRLIMSSIGVNAPVEGLGTTPDGLMAVPQAYGMVGWYNKGVTPGQDGPAVLVGHYTAGAGGVFDKLHSAKDGDLITVTNGRGESFTYKITKMAEYEKDKVPMAEIFKKGNGSRLEIITCAGKWQADNYDKRLVVTAELVQ